MQKLPIGIQDFEKIRVENYLYVDKTKQIHTMLNGAGYYFLSRPRRFGKSLLVNTLKNIFLGKKELFKGLFIEDKIEWQTFPVIHLDFAKADYKQIGLENSIKKRLEHEAELYEVKLESETISSQLEELIRKLHKKYDKRVVLLIDEYDKPIIDFLGKDEIHIALENRNIMKNFYTPIKSLDAKIHFFLLTGVSKFSKVSIFSELNNLNDLTVDNRFSSMLGYTELELENYFDRYINKLSKKYNLNKKETLQKLREWYNGYWWTGRNETGQNENRAAKETVYNPFSVMSAFEKSVLDNYWFETGTPTFLIKLMSQNYYYDVSDVETDLFSLGDFDVARIEIIPVLFQTGYITLKEQTEFDLYRLGYPNKEVKNSMLKLLLSEFSHKEKSETNTLLIKMKRSFDAVDLETFFIYLNVLFAKIPYQIFEKHKESYYHSIIFLVFELLGYYTDAEVNTSIGRIDAMVRTKDTILIFEFKVNNTAENAIQQMKDKKYAEKYLSENKTIYLIRVACQEKTIEDYLIEKL